MNTWEEFEIECTNYLNEKFGKYAYFEHRGGANANLKDIFVTTQYGQSFFMDVKLSPAQCNQFVLFPNIEKRIFEYSSKNDKPINRYSKMIMEFMNSDFDGFREAGTAGKEIIMSNSKEIFAKWIIQVYSEKNTKFFISNNFTIIPIESISDFFDISAKYRIKRSGSRNVGRRGFQFIKDYFRTSELNISEYKTSGDKLFVTSLQDLHDYRFILGKYEYMLSLRDDEYEVRKLSNTYNANVIFSIKLKEKVLGLSDRAFIAYLN